MGTTYVVQRFHTFFLGGGSPCCIRYGVTHTTRSSREGATHNRYDYSTLRTRGLTRRENSDFSRSSLKAEQQGRAGQTRLCSSPVQSSRWEWDRTAAADTEEEETKTQKKPHGKETQWKKKDKENHLLYLFACTFSPHFFFSLSPGLWKRAIFLQCIDTFVILLPGLGTFFPTGHLNRVCGVSCGSFCFLKKGPGPFWGGIPGCVLT